MENVNKKRKKKQQKKDNYLKEVCLFVVGALTMFTSQLINTASTQIVTKGELQRLEGNYSLVATDVMINNHQKLSDFILIVGICLLFLSAGMMIFKRVKEEKEEGK